MKSETREWIGILLMFIGVIGMIICYICFEV